MTAAAVAAGPAATRLAIAAGAVVAGLATAGAVVVLSAHSQRDLLLLLAGAGLAGLAVTSARMAVAVTVATFFFWALVRRLVPVADPSVDPAAIVPYLVALPLAVRGLRVQKPPAVVVLAAWATAAALLSFRPLVGAAGWLNFVAPLLAAFAVARIPSGAEVLARWTVLCGSTAATYGIVQYVVPFRWDERWLGSAHFVSVGAFGRTTFRPFATLPAPGTAAVLTALVIMLVLFRRDLYDPPAIVRVWALTACTLFLLVGQVRTAWISCALAALLGFLTRAGRSGLRVAACIAVAVVAMSFAPQAGIVAERASTLTNLDADTSFRGRVAFLRGATRLVTPVGSGLGTRSSASRVEGDQSIDGGFLVVLAETGLVGLGLLLWALADAARRARGAHLPFFGFLVVSSFAGFMFGGLVGILLWTLSGAAARPPGPDPLDVPDGRPS